jgi:lambda family phage portal protein
VPALASALRWLTGGLPRPVLQPGGGNPFSPLGGPFGPYVGPIPPGQANFLVPPAGLEAGSTRRRLTYWQPASAHINSLMRTAGPTVVARARWLVRNNGYAKAALRAWSAATVGPGIKPSSLIADTELRNAVQVAWALWTDEADAEDVTDFYGFARRVAREAFLAGECFVRFRPRFPQDGLSVPLQLQLIPSEQLSMWRLITVPDGMGNAGGNIRMGIEFDRNLRDKRVAYWFFRANPTDQTLSFSEAFRQQQLVRVPAEEVIHVFDPVEAGQLRGLTGYAAAIVKLFQLDLYDDAEVERQKQQARYATFIETSQEYALAMQDEGSPLEPRPDDDPAVWGPGATVHLYPGEEVKFAQPAGVAGGYEPFQFRTLLQICASLGIPYAELSADLSKATYASSRAGLLAFRSEVEAFQHAVLVYQFLRKVWVRWMDAAVLAGAIPGLTASLYNAQPALYRAMQAITPRTPWVDPLKDRQAMKLAVDSQVMAPQDAIEAEGLDIETVYARIAEAQKLREKYGIPDAPLGWTGHAAPVVKPPAPGSQPPTDQQDDQDRQDLEDAQDQQDQQDGNDGPDNERAA